MDADSPQPKDPEFESSGVHMSTTRLPVFIFLPMIFD